MGTNVTSWLWTTLLLFILTQHLTVDGINISFVIENEEGDIEDLTDTIINVNSYEEFLRAVEALGLTVGTVDPQGAFRRMFDTSSEMLEKDSFKIFVNNESISSNENGRLTVKGDLHVSGNVILTADLVVEGNLYVDGVINHTLVGGLPVPSVSVGSDNDVDLSEDIGRKTGIVLQKEVDRIEQVLQERIPGLRIRFVDDPSIIASPSLVPKHPGGMHYVPVINVTVPNKGKEEGETWVFDATGAVFGGSVGLQGICSNAVVAQPPDGCSQLQNAAEVAGRMVIMYRGECFFALKALEAQRASAAAVLIVDYPGNEEFIEMAGLPENHPESRAVINIPVRLVSHEFAVTLQHTGSVMHPDESLAIMVCFSWEETEEEPASNGAYAVELDLSSVTTPFNVDEIQALLQQQITSILSDTPRPAGKRSSLRSPASGQSGESETRRRSTPEGSLSVAGCAVALSRCFNCSDLEVWCNSGQRTGGGCRILSDSESSSGDTSVPLSKDGRVKIGLRASIPKAPNGWYCAYERQVNGIEAHSVCCN